jgi:calcineurin-like phosphoesterase family protein
VSNIFFTSDTHFFHDQDFVWKARGFSCVEEMNETIVERWNSIVSPDDIVYHLGDIMLGNYDVNILKRLNGIIDLIHGNHDTDRKLGDIYATNKVTATIGYTSELLKFGKLKFFICHYPVLTANFDDSHFSQHVICLHGHTHQRGNWLFPDNPFIYHVGMDSHDCYPVHLDTIVNDIRNRWNELGRLNINPTGIYNNYPIE